MDISLEPYGDKELWIARGTLPAGRWSLPLYVWHYRDAEGQHYVRATPIQPISPAQSEVLKRQLNSSNLWDREDSFILPASWFIHRCTKAEGITPDYYRAWPGEELKQPAGPDKFLAAAAEIPESDEEFLAFVSQKRAIKLSVLKLAWWAICAEAPRWLLERRRAIDFGFVKLLALPYRCNWKQIILAKAPWAINLFKLPPEERETQMIKLGFLPLLCTEDNLALDKGSEQLRWTLECLPQKKWSECCDRLEGTALLHGPGQYVARYERLIFKLKDIILESLASFVAQMAVPAGALRPGFKRGSRRLVARHPLKLEMGTAARPEESSPPAPAGDACIVITDPDHPAGAASLLVDLPKTIKELPDLPPLLPPIADLWQRRLLDEPSDPSI